jgi:poly(A) polymerase
MHPLGIDKDRMSEEFRAAVRICKLLQDNGFDGVIAGGCLRDMIRLKPFKDIDLATNADPDVMIPLLNVNGIQTKYVGKAFGVTLAKIDDYEFEIARFRKDVDCDGRHPNRVEFCSMREDALRRDFTINAVFYDPIAEDYRDYIDGIKDILHMKLRFVGNPADRIQEDYLRILRYVRFYNLGFSTDIIDRQQIDYYAHEMAKTVSVERIQMELMKVISVMSNIKMFLDFPKLMSEIFYHLPSMQSVKQSPTYHPEGNVYNHTLLTVERIVKNGCSSPLIILAAIFHDFGKKETTKFVDGDWHSYNHEKASEDIVREWMTIF